MTVEDHSDRSSDETQHLGKEEKPERLRAQKLHPRELPIKGMPDFTSEGFCLLPATAQKTTNPSDTVILHIET